MSVLFTRKPLLNNDTKVTFCNKTPTTVVNIHRTTQYDVYIGRPSVWGNPFVIGKDGTREEVVYLYQQYLYQRPELIKKAKEELKGKILGCYCKPYLCHGDILKKVIEE